jgi:dTMP kinase
VHIVLEGADAAGKATQTALLAEFFRAQGRDVRVYSFPQYDVAPFGPAIRAELQRADASPLTLQAHMLCDKLSAAAKIKSEVLDDCVVICDRWWPSGYVYAVAEGLNPDRMLACANGLPDADVTILIDVSLEEARRRKPLPDDRLEESTMLQRRVRSLYAELFANAHLRGRADMLAGAYHVIDGNADVATVHARILDLLRNIL